MQRQSSDLRAKFPVFFLSFMTSEIVPMTFIKITIGKRKRTVMSRLDCVKGILKNRNIQNTIQ